MRARQSMPNSRAHAPRHTECGVDKKVNGTNNGGRRHKVEDSHILRKL